MRNLMIFFAILIVAVIAYKAFAPYLESKGIDMNLTAIDDTNVEHLEEK